jgi:hypothetical protein
MTAVSKYCPAFSYKTRTDAEALGAIARPARGRLAKGRPATAAETAARALRKAKREDADLYSARRDREDATGGSTALLELLRARHGETYVPAEQDAHVISRAGGGR